MEAAVGGNSLVANVLAALLGACLYFATLTEVPIVQGLVGAGMARCHHSPGSVASFDIAL